MILVTPFVGALVRPRRATAGADRPVRSASARLADHDVLADGERGAGCRRCSARSSSPRSPAAVSAVGAVATAEQFPGEGRITGLALGATMATAIFGGLTPCGAQWLVERTGWHMAPGAMIALVALCVSARCSLAFAIGVEHGEPLT